MKDQDARRHYIEWRDCIYSTERARRSLAERAAARIYAQIGEPRPWFLLVEGPYQLTILPAVFAAVLRSKSWDEVSLKFRSTVHQENSWDTFWTKLWDDLIAELFSANAAILHHVTVQEFVRERAIACLKSELLRRLKAESRQADDIIPRLQKQFGSERILNRKIRASIRIRSDELRRTFQTSLEHGQVEPMREETWVGQFNRIVAISRRLAPSISRNLMWQTGDLHDEPHAANWIAWENPWLAEVNAAADRISELSMDRDELEVLTSWLDLAKSASACRFDDVICTLCDHPTSIRIDGNDFIHNADGPAIQFADGFVGYQARGMFIEPEFILDPKKMKIETVEKVQNVELRRALLDIYGEARYLEETQAELIHEDEFGRLYRKSFGNDEPLLMVRVKNSTPEPDGTWRHYFLRVPPTMRTAREAVAWTFGLDQEQYSPDAET